MKYEAFVWPKYQEFMGEDWFEEESYYDYDADTYLIPENRVQEFYEKKSFTKHKVGDKVTIKSIDWYNDNKDYWGNVPLEHISFVPGMNNYCGKTATIVDITEDCHYNIDIDKGAWYWSDEMFEEL